MVFFIRRKVHTAIKAKSSDASDNMRLFLEICRPQAFKHFMLALAVLPGQKPIPTHD